MASFCIQMCDLLWESGLGKDKPSNSLQEQRKVGMDG